MSLSTICEVGTKVDSQVTVFRKLISGGHSLGIMRNQRVPAMQLPRLTCQYLAGLPGTLGLGGRGGWQGPSAPGQMLLSAERAPGAVEWLQQHLL